MQGWSDALQMRMWSLKGEIHYDLELAYVCGLGVSSRWAVRACVSSMSVQLPIDHVDG